MQLFMWLMEFVTLVAIKETIPLVPYHPVRETETSFKIAYRFHRFVPKLQWLKWDNKVSLA